MPRTHQSQPVAQFPNRTELRLGAAVGPREEFSFITADGVRSPEEFRLAERRLLDVLVEDPPDSLLLPEANYGVVGTVMAAFGTDVTMAESSARAARLCRINAERNGLESDTSVAISADLRSLPGSFSAAALAPAAYEPCSTVEQRIADALAAIEPNGVLFLAVAASAGVARYRRTLGELSPDSGPVDERDGCVILRARRPSEVDPPRYAAPRELHPTIDGTPLTLVSYPGLFSAGGLDAGTRELVRALDIRDGERVLDLACGYGPLGIYAARTADCDVTLTDDDRVATACARRSAKLTGVPSVEVVTADGVAGVRDEAFDRVVCNPPTHAGSGVLHHLMAGARDVLRDDGRLDVVHHDGIDFERYVDPYFDRITGRTSGDYRIVTARR